MGAFGTCSTTVLNLIGVQAEYIGPAPVTFDGCYATNPAATSTFNVGSMAECIEGCTTSSQVSLRVKGLTETCGLLGGVVGALLGGRSGGTWECSCSNTEPSGQMVNCNAETSSTGLCTILGGAKTRNYAWNVYSRDTVVSDVPVNPARRRRNMAFRAPEETYCPRPKVACRIPKYDSFECLDTSTELGELEKKLHLRTLADSSRGLRRLPLRQLRQQHHFGH